MRKPIAIVDLDDTLNELQEAVVESLLNRGRIACRPPLTSSDCQECFGVTWEEFQKVLYEDRCLERAHPIPGIQDALERLREDMEPWIVTSRSWHPYGQAITEGWMRRHHVPYDRILLVPYPQPKALFLTTVRERIGCVVDDLARHVNSIRRISGCEGYLVERPWNREATGDFRRIAHVAEAADHAVAFSRYRPGPAHLSQERMAEEENLGPQLV